MKTSIKFLEKSPIAAILSLLLVAGSLYLLSTRWLNLGLDFTGGMTIELQATDSQAIDQERMRQVLNDNGYESAQVQSYGSNQDVQIRLPLSNQDEQAMATQIQDLLKSNQFSLSFQGQSLVGPQVGKELIERGSQALLFSLIGILIYISMRFQWKLSVGAVVALVHDLIITLGFFSLTGIEFNLTVLAALLAVMGYSVNDTVVVFDRIRENFRKFHSGAEIDLINLSINQTMSRTIITSGTTLLSVLALFLFGGPILYGFSVALMVGIGIGTYSSIFVASALALKLGLSRNDLDGKKAELVDELP